MRRDLQERRDEVEFVGPEVEAKRAQGGEEREDDGGNQRALDQEHGRHRARDRHLGVDDGPDHRVRALAKHPEHEEAEEKRADEGDEDPRRGERLELVRVEGGVGARVRGGIAGRGGRGRRGVVRAELGLVPAHRARAVPLLVRNQRRVEIELGALHAPPVRMSVASGASWYFPAYASAPPAAVARITARNTHDQIASCLRLRGFGGRDRVSEKRRRRA